MPIIFVDRRVGQSKMCRAIFVEALVKVWKLRFSGVPTGSRPEAGGPEASVTVTPPHRPAPAARRTPVGQRAGAARGTPSAAREACSPST